MVPSAHVSWYGSLMLRTQKSYDLHEIAIDTETLPNENMKTSSTYHINPDTITSTNSQYKSKFDNWIYISRARQRFIWCNSTSNRPVMQIPRCTSPATHNAPFTTEMCPLCTPLTTQMAHCGIPARSTAGSAERSIVQSYQLSEQRSCYCHL